MLIIWEFPELAISRGSQLIEDNLGLKGNHSHPARNTPCSTSGLSGKATKERDLEANFTA